MRILFAANDSVAGWLAAGFYFVMFAAFLVAMYGAAVWMTERVYRLIGAVLNVLIARFPVTTFLLRPFVSLWAWLWHGDNPRDEPAYLRRWRVKVEPPPPPPRSPIQLARDRYEAKVRQVEAAGLSESELNAAKRKLKMQYLRELDTLMQ